MRPLLAALGLLLLLTACGSAPGPKNKTLPDRKARKAKLLSTVGSSSQPFILHTSPFRLFGLRPRTLACQGRTMHLYIEGDGLSWKTRHTPSEDPTPLDPLVGRLYRMDPIPCKVYLARPCMYLHDPVCRQSDWTSQRYSSRVIGSYQQALNQLKARYRNRDYILIGHSGGGTIATLTAARRHDIRRLVTLAGNLDTDTWTAIHRTAPLRGSLNPVDEAAALRTLPQTHLVGGADTNVPETIYESYRKHFPEDAPIQEITFSSNTHTHGWESTWRNYLKQIH